MASYETSAELRRAVEAAETVADAKLAKLGKLSASARMKLLFDEGTFVETGKYIGRKSTELDSGEDDSLEPVVTGYGAVNGVLVFAFSQDYSRLSGALGEMHAKRFAMSMIWLRNPVLLSWAFLTAQVQRFSRALMLSRATAK